MAVADGDGAKVILYARVSTEEQAKSGYSLAQQLDALREHAAREGYGVLEEVTDPGQSGASLERPGMDRVRDLVAGGGVSVVLAQDRDRFAREPALHYLLRQELGEQGCELRALNDRGDDSPEGELTDGILDQLAKFERAKTAERTRRGRLRKVREGKLVGNGAPDYGFRFNERKDGYEVNAETMPMVERILRMVGEEGYAIHGVARVLNGEGKPAPGGGRWNTAFVRKLILDDVYRRHSREEVSALVSPEVAAGLNPGEHYGVYWYNRVRRVRRQVSEAGPGGKRAYRTRSTTTHKPREEWVAVPVADPGIPRELVDAAREAIKDNKKTSSAGSRFWELSGGVARCAECGSALTPLTVNRKGRGKVDHYYRCLGHYQRRICPNNKHYRADELEARVAQGIWLLFRDPEKVMAHLDERIEREALRDPAEEAKVWEERISALEKKISRAQDLAIEGLVSKEQLREKVEALGAEKRAAERELKVLEDRRGHLEQLEQDRRVMLNLYAQGLMGAFDHFPAEDRHEVYKKLKLRALAYRDGMLELAGSFDANVLPTGNGAAESHARMNRGVLRKDKSWSHLAYGRFGGSSPATTTTRRFR